ncbi:MAG: KH domain-containing protein [Acidimicrobiales bacterium]
MTTDGERLDRGAYEPGDVNVADPTGSVDDDGYEAGDVNTLASRAGSGDGATTDAGNRAPGGTASAVLTYLARSLADEPDAVEIRTEDRRGSMVLRVHVAPDDMGRVIGRRGRTAQAIRTLVGVAGARDDVRTVVDIVDDD